MRKLTVLVLILLCFLLNLKVYATGYVDDMDKIDNSTSKSYSNLTTTSATGAWGALPDSSFLSIANPGIPRAEVVYKVQNAQTLSVTSYSASSTAVYKNANNQYLLGSLSGGVSTPITVKYSPSFNKAYIFAEGRMMRLTYQKRVGYIFKDTEESPSDLIPYGVSVWTSTDGKSYQLANQSRLSSSFNSGAQLYSESWSSVIPVGTQFIKVEINDVTFIESFDTGENYPKSSNTMTMIARVNIEGSNLILGTAEPIKEESVITTLPETAPTSPNETESKPKTAPKPKANTPASSSETKTSEKSSQESPATQKKFEGSVTIEQPSSTKKSSSSSNKSTAKPAEKEELEPKPDSSLTEEAPPTTVFYVDDNSGEKDGFSSFVMFYIVAVIALIVFVLFRPKKK